MALTIAINAALAAGVLAAILSLCGLAIRGPRPDRPVVTTAARHARRPQRTRAPARSAAKAGEAAADLS